MSTIIIGKNSFLATHLNKRDGAVEWEFLTHSEALDRPNDLKDAKIIVNCAFHPDLHTDPYEVDKDCDFAIASLIQNSGTHYVMMSSRMVYGPAPFDLVLREDAPLEPDTQYGKNKLKIEQALQGVLPDKHLTILRMSNIFGFEPNRSSFFGHMITALKNEGEIRFDIAPASQRDFLSVWAWADHVDRILRAPEGGVYNIGSGFGTSPQELADILIKHAGGGKVVYTDKRVDGQFVLDVRKGMRTFGLTPYTQMDLLTDVEKVAELSMENQINK